MRKTILLVINNKYRYNYNFSLYNEKPPNLGTVPVIIGSGIIIIIDKENCLKSKSKRPVGLNIKRQRYRNLMLFADVYEHPPLLHVTGYLPPPLPLPNVKISHNFHCLKIIYICEHFFKAETTDFRYI